MGPRGRHQAPAAGASTLEFVVVFTVLLGLLLAVVQTAIWFHARAVAVTAATHGLDAARVTTGSVAGGQSMTNQFLDQTGGWLRNREVRVERGATTARVSVGGEALAVLPGVPLRLTVHVAAPVERVVP